MANASAFPARAVIEKFGGIRPLSRLLGHRNASTVQGWYERGIIPPNHQRAVIEAGRGEGIEVRAEEFIPGMEAA